MASAFTRILALAVLSAGLAACGAFCPPVSDFQDASSGSYYSDRTPLPLNAWVRNPKLESFVESAVQAGGVAALTAQYGFQCAPRPKAVGCTDCYTCDKTQPQTESRAPVFPVPIAMCQHVGDLQLHVEVGPGTAVTAMTYWKGPPTLWMTASGR